MLNAAAPYKLPEGEAPEYAILRLKSGGFAVAAPIRPGRPIHVYGFRSEAEAAAWIERMKARLVK